MKAVFMLLLISLAAGAMFSQDNDKKPQTEKAEAVLARAIEALGGAKYREVRTQIGRGKFSSIAGGSVVSFKTFVDVLVFPDKERTEFKGQGSRTIQVNTGGTGWVYDGDQQLVRDQTERQIANYRQSVRTSLDNLLRRWWTGEADLSYVGRRPGSLGKRNDVVKLTYRDGFAVEFEFTDDGLPAKAIYKVTDPDGADTVEEDRYGQFIETGGIKTPYVIDHLTDGKPSSRINYETVEINVAIAETWFAKPANAKDAKKEFKY